MMLDYYVKLVNVIYCNWCGKEEMKKYFITSDIHSFYTPFIKELTKKSFDINNEEHILVICGDIFDRGNESLKTYEFIRSLPKERRILIRGNHEYLFIDLLFKDIPDYYDRTNGTVKTFIDLTKNKYKNWYDLVLDKKLNEIKKWILSNEWTDYYETKKYIFTHAFIPLNIDPNSFLRHMYNVDERFLSNKENWKESTPEEFENATWGCPWKLAKAGLNKTGKTIICGHWHTSDFYNNLKNLNKKYDTYKNNPIFVSKKYKLIGLDACTAATNKVNVLVFEEDEL